MEVFSDSCRLRHCFYGAFFALCVFLTSCTLGPDYHPQKPPTNSSYNQKTLPKKTASSRGLNRAGKAQYFVNGRDIPAEWWKLFKSKEINSLVEMGLSNSPSFEEAKAALTQAREMYYAQRGNLLYPGADLTLSGQRQKFAGSTFGGNVASSLFNLFNASVAVAYTLDVFGGNKRTVENYLAQADYQQFQLLATYLTLTSNIVTTAITAASYQEQINVTRRLVDLQSKQLNVMRKQYSLGGISKVDLLAQETLVEQTKATLPPLQKTLSQTRHALSVLLGKNPDEKLPEIKLSNITLPSELPVSVPSKLVKQRPDIRAAEANLHAASAEIGVATANLFPTFSLTGNYGWNADTISGLFKPLTNAWDYGLEIGQPLYHGGGEIAYRRSVIAAYQQALAQYKQTLLQAFQNTADSLRALETDARALKNSKAAEYAAKDAFNIANKQYRLGGVSYIDLLNAQNQYQQTRLASIQAEALRYSDTVALFQSLGGGWWNSKLFKCNDQLNPTKASLTCP